MLVELDIDAFIAQKSTFDLLIDARSPKEYHESHIENAHNFYALNDVEHQEIGTLYKHTSRNDAKVLGARYICQNVAAHLEMIAKTHKIGSKIGIYCARGGLRSSSIAIILSHIGYQVYRLRGGYKQYRFYVLSYLETLPHQRFIVLGGNTGCGKSELIQKLHPIIDLEQLANHLGSSFGHIKGAQPSQKAFENSLCEILCKIDPYTPVFVEAESKKMGTCTIPSLLHTRILQGYRVEITASLQARIDRILNVYKGMPAPSFHQAIQAIAPYIKKSIKEEVLLAYEKGDLAVVAKMLLVEYYDVVYKKPLQCDARFENDNQAETVSALKSLHVKLSAL